MHVIAAFMLTACSLLVSATAANAKQDPDVEQRYTKAYRECITTGAAAQGVQSAMNLCAAEEYERQDTQLNKTYVSVFRRQATSGRTRLRGLQREWIKARDRTCAAEEKEHAGGSMAPLFYSGCLSRETIKRILWLERHR